MDKKSFGARLRRMRKELRLTQEALIEELQYLGYSDSESNFISPIERGERSPTVEQLWFLLRYFVQRGQLRSPQQAQSWVALLGRTLSESELGGLFGDQGKEAYPAVQPEWSVPPEPSYYVVPKGAMAELEAAITRDDWHGQWPIVVTGMGGVGKTTLLKAFAHRPELRTQFRYALWADLEARGAQHWQKRWGEILGLDLGEVSDAESRRGILEARLEHEAALLLINDVWEASEAKPLLVGGPACRTVISTREELPVSAELRVGSRARIYVEPLGREAGLALLHKYLGKLSEREEEYAAEIVRLVEGLPLALEILAILLRYSGEWLEILSDLRDPSYLPDLPPGQEKYESVWRAFMVGYERLDEDLQRYFRMLGALAERASFGWETASALWFMDERGTRDVLLTLQGRHFVHREESGRYRLHQLVHRFARSLMTDEEAKTSYQLLVEHFQQRIEALGNQFTVSGQDTIASGLAGVELEWPQVQELAQGAARRDDWDSGYRLLMVSAHYLAAQGKWSVLEEWCERLAGSAGHCKGSKWADVVRNWGLVLMARGRYSEAASRLKEALAWTQDDGERFGIYIGLAGAYIALQDRKLAWKYLRKSEPLVERYPALSARYYKARATWEQHWGDSALARQLLLQAERSFRALGAALDATAIMEKRAELCFKMGDIAQAVTLYRQVAAERRAYGQLRGQVGSLIQVGRILWQSHQNEELQALYDDELLELWERLPDDRKEAQWWRLMGFFAERVQDISGCRRFWGKALDLPGLDEQQKAEIRLEWAFVELDDGDRQTAVHLLADAESYFRQVNDVEALADVERFKRRAGQPLD